MTVASRGRAESENSPDFIDHVLHQLDAVGPIRARRMFGGHSISLNGIYFAIAAWNTLYLRVDDACRERFVSAGSKPFTYQSRGRAVQLPYFSAPEECLESTAAMGAWARIAVEAALRQRRP